MRRVEAGICITSVTLALACSDFEPQPSCVEARLESESIEFLAVGHDFSDTCTSGFDAAESHRQWVAQAWGQTELDSIPYFLFDSTDHSCWPCNGEGACVSTEGLATIQLPHRHELAHTGNGECFTLIEEGWAMLYGDHFLDDVTAGDIREVISEGKLPGDDYSLAARFVAFLIDTRGIGSLRALCQIPATTPAQFEAALVEAYGQSLEELATEFDNYPEWSLGELRHDQGCEDTEPIVAPGVWQQGLDCDAGDVEFGPRDSRMVHQLFELPEAGHYSFTFSASVDLELRVELRACQRSGPASVFFSQSFIYPKVDEPRERVYFDLPSGRYVLRVLADEVVTEPSSSLSVALTSWP